MFSLTGSKRIITVTENNYFSINSLLFFKYLNFSICVTLQKMCEIRFYILNTFAKLINKVYPDHLSLRVAASSLLQLPSTAGFAGRNESACSSKLCNLNFT